MYIDIHGKALCINHNTGDIADMEFKAKNGKNYCYVFTQIKPKDDEKPALFINGRFTQSFTLTDTRTNPESEYEIWRATPPPDNFEHNYNFPKFTL
jgi:hypothetical protein